MKPAGNDVRTAHDGREAVEPAEEFLPDVVLLDIGLPALNGYGAAGQIRGHSWSQGIVHIALTGWGQDEDRRRLKEAGFDRRLIEQVDPDALDETPGPVPRRPCGRPRRWWHP